MECNILIVDPEEKTRDFFYEAFSNGEVKAFLAEEVNLVRAISFIETENLHYLFLGPNLQPVDISDFIKKTDVCSNMPVIVFLSRENKHLEEELIREGITSTLPYPIEKAALVDSITVAKEKFYGEKTDKDGSSQNAMTKQDTTGIKPRIGSAHQLALVLSKLSIRLNDFSKLLSVTPIETDIRNSSIPAAVNQVITGVSKLRHGKEDEDVKKLFEEMIK
jgi:DNA-binding NtrC family response regulator